MALYDRIKQWNVKETIGDVVYASFSKSIVLKLYSSVVCNFSIAMDSIKETCKLVPAFLNFACISISFASIACIGTIRNNLCMT